MSTDRTTEMLNYLTAIIRDIGEFRAETNARFAEVDARFERLETQVRTRFDAVETRLGGVETRLDHLETETHALYGEMTGMRADMRDIRDEMRIRGSRLDRLQVKVEENQDDIRDLKPRVSTLEGKT